MVFQDPYGSLDPRMTVADIIGEGIDIHKIAKNKKERQEIIYKYLELVGLNREHANRFVHEFSGKNRFVQLVLFCKFLAGEDQSAAGSAKRLVRCSRRHMSIGNRTRMLPRCMDMI